MRRSIGTCSILPPSNECPPQTADRPDNLRRSHSRIREQISHSYLWVVKDGFGLDKDSLMKFGLVWLRIL